MKKVTLHDKRRLRSFLKSVDEISDVNTLGFLPDGTWVKDPDNVRKYYMIYLMNVDAILENIFKIKVKKHLSVDKSITVFFKELEDTLTKYFKKKWRA